MIRGVIAGKDFYNDFEAMRYWSFPSSYDSNKRKETLNSMLYSGDYIASEKKDGYFERFIKDEEGNMYLCSRNKGVNGVIDKYDWVPHLHKFFEALPNGTVLLGEVYLPNKTSKNIVSVLGCLVDKAISRQQKDEDKLHFWIFDILAWNNELIYHKSMWERAELLKKYFGRLNHQFINVSTFWDNPDDILENWLTILAQGGEGIVMIHRDYPYEFNKRTARKTLKLKKELQETIDVFLTGRWKEATYFYTGKDIETWPYWYDNLKKEKVYGTMYERKEVGDSYDAVTRLWYMGMAGAVEIALMKDGHIVPIGWISGISDEIRKGIIDNYKEFQGKVAELQAMEIDRSGDIPTLRHGRIVRWREDKNYKECTWDQIE